MPEARQNTAGLSRFQSVVVSLYIVLCIDWYLVTAPFFRMNFLLLFTFLSPTLSLGHFPRSLCHFPTVFCYARTATVCILPELVGGVFTNASGAFLLIFGGLTDRPTNVPYYRTTVFDYPSRLGALVAVTY